MVSSPHTTNNLTTHETDLLVNEKAKIYNCDNWKLHSSKLHWKNSSDPGIHIHTMYGALYYTFALINRIYVIDLNVVPFISSPFRDLRKANDDEKSGNEYTNEVFIYLCLRVIIA